MDMNIRSAQEIINSRGSGGELDEVLKHASPFAVESVNAAKNEQDAARSTGGISAGPTISTATAQNGMHGDALSTAKDTGATPLPIAEIYSKPKSDLLSAPEPSSVPAQAHRANHQMQLVDERQEFTKDFKKYLSQWDILNTGMDYQMVAVFGSQSTGKSTLLNRVFGTTFPVMDESRGRAQTTKGIWMSRAAIDAGPSKQGILVMDVEGTDGRERGEDQDFERKSALFSMATSGILLVNLWEHQIGLYQGANLGLLKTVFEVNLGLFQAAQGRGSRDRTLILFVIRDHIGTTPLSSLSETLSQDINRMWSSLSKPEGLTEVALSQFFDLAFASLPHKILQPKEFDTGIDDLRKRFVDMTDRQYVFKPSYHKNIPADGLPIFTSQIWEQILQNKDLDLPTQQEMLAQFRCDEIASVAFEIFVMAYKVLRKPIESGQVLEHLGPTISKARDELLQRFDADASRYHKSVYEKKRSALLTQANTALEPLYYGQVKNLQREVIRNFREQVRTALKADKYDFAQVIRKAKSDNLSHFQKAAQTSTLSETGWSFAEIESQVNVELDEIAKVCREEETKKVVNSINRKIRSGLADPVEVEMGKPGPEMWNKIIRAFTQVIESASSDYVEKAQGFQASEDEIQTGLGRLRWQGWQTLREKINEQVVDTVLLSRLRNTFEDAFRYDEAGTPRIWKPEDDIDTVFRKARDQTLELIPLYGKMSWSESMQFTVPKPVELDDIKEESLESESNPVLLSDAKQRDLAHRFRRDSDAYYVEVKRSMVSSIARIPYWMYGALVFLGWNEFVAVIRSPIYFTLLLLGLAGAYIVWQLNLVGPLTTITNTVINECVRMGKEKLHEHFNEGAIASREQVRTTPLPETKEKVEDVPLEDLSAKGSTL